MVGVFVQVNESSRKGHSNPIGYVIQENGCWDWVGSRNMQGYGRWSVMGRQYQAHRVMYEKANGQVPRGLELDHLCRNPACVNPDHLEPVTHRENMRRSVSPIAKTADNPKCAYGHPYTENNTYWRPDGEGRQCRVCIQKWRHNRRAKECPRGHAYSESTAYWRPKAGPICLICNPTYPNLRRRSRG